MTTESALRNTIATSPHTDGPQPGI